MYLLFKFPTDAVFYDLSQAARKMRLSVAELEEMAHTTEVDADVVGWTCIKGHDGTWRLSLLGRMDLSANGGEDRLNIDMPELWRDIEATNRRRDRWGKESR